MSEPIAFLGTVEKGKFVPDSPRDFTMEFLRREKKRVVVTVKDWRKNRSNRQNAYWWGVVVPMFAHPDCMACSPDEAHEALKAELNCEFREVGDRLIRIPKSTANLTTLEFKELVEKAQRLAGEMWPGMTIPDPGSPQADALIDDKVSP